MKYFNFNGVHRKRNIITALFVMVAGVVYAQRSDSTVMAITSEGNFWKNWFIRGAVGQQIYFGDHNKQMKVGDRFTPAFDFGVGKWFTPGVGIRSEISGFKVKGVSGWSSNRQNSTAGITGNYEGFIVNPKYDASGKFISGDVYGKEKTGTYDLYKTEIKFIHFHIDALLNISQLGSNYKPDRVYSFIPYAGFGFMSSLNRNIKGEKSYELTGSIGLLNSFRLNSSLDLNIDVRGSLVNERFDGQIGNRWGEGLLSGTVGLTYNFKKRGWDKKVITRVYSGDDKYYTEKIEELQKENLALSKQLRTDAKGQTVIEKKLAANPQLVIFPKGTAFLSKDARVNLGFLAKVMTEMNAQSPTNYIITGYADKGTGTKTINEALSSERALVVKECLVKEFGIPASMLKTRHEGGVDNMFYADPMLSRCVIITAE